MSEDRSIAEIIGLDNVRQLCVGPDGELLRPPTVDDLLAWLRQQPGLLEIECFVYRSSGAEVRVYIDDAEHASHFAQSERLIDALETAVREVAA